MFALDNGFDRGTGGGDNTPKNTPENTPKKASTELVDIHLGGGMNVITQYVESVDMSALALGNLVEGVSFRVTEQTLSTDEDLVYKSVKDQLKQFSTLDINEIRSLWGQALAMRGNAVMEMAAQIMAKMSQRSDYRQREMEDMAHVVLDHYLAMLYSEGGSNMGQMCNVLNSCEYFFSERDIMMLRLFDFIFRAEDLDKKPLYPNNQNIVIQAIYKWKIEETQEGGDFLSRYEESSINNNQPKLLERVPEKVRDAIDMLVFYAVGYNDSEVDVDFEHYHKGRFFDAKLTFRDNGTEVFVDYHGQQDHYIQGDPKQKNNKTKARDQFCDEKNIPYYTVSFAEIKLPDKNMYRFVKYELRDIEKKQEWMEICGKAY